MKIKLTPLYILSFFALVFLVHEIHDWLHVLLARAFSGCWGTKAFDAWTICTKKGLVSNQGNVLILIVPPLFNYLVISRGWQLMQPENEVPQQALGFSLVFASLPLPRMLAARVGGGDETAGLRLLFQHADQSNRHYIALAGLVIVLALILPALYRAVILLAGWWKLMVVGFLVVPWLVDRWVETDWLNRLLGQGFLSHQVWTGFSLAVMVWLFLLVILVIFTYHILVSLFDYREIDL